MSTIKVPVYRIYFYLVILLLGTSVLASSGITSFLGFDQKTESFEEQDQQRRDFSASKRIYFLPSYIDDSTEHIAFTQTCFQADDSTQFFAVTDEDSIVRYSWDFGVPVITYDTSNQKNPYYFYPAAGQYDVTLKYFKMNGDSITVDTTVNISGDITPPNLLPDTAICPDQFPFTLEAYVDGQYPAGAKYIWSTGETDSVINAKRPGNYWVAVTVGTCTRIEEIEVTEYGTPRKRAAVWHFGTKGGINFNTMEPNDSAKLLNAPEGSAAISDIDGKLLFYTDGNTVYNRDHEPLKNGDSIGGDLNSTQSSIIVPWPSRLPYYFLFTTEETNSEENRLSVSLIDMKGDSADGEVIYKNNVVVEPVTEKITAFARKNSAGVDSIYWLVTQEAGSGAFKVFKIDSTGINQPPLTFDFGRPASGTESEGQIKISNTGKYIAVAMGDKVDLYSFNDSTGTITDSVSIDVKPGGAYGVEFSPDGSKLYVSNSAGIYQIDIADSAGTRLPNDTITSPKHISQIASGSNFGALQIAPDYNIYVAIQGATSLGVIRNASAEEDEVVFNDKGFALAPGTQSTKGLPNFVQSFIEPPQGPSLGYSDICGPGVMQFFGSGWGDRDNFDWQISTLGGSSVFSASGKMKTQVETSLELGKYVVRLRVYNDCPMDTVLWDTVTVVGGPEPINLPNSVTLCQGGSRTLIAGRNQPGVTFTWSTGATDTAITVSQYGTYSVIAMKDNGCSETGTVRVVPPTFGNIIGDTTLCAGDITRLSTSSPGLQHSWYRNGVLQQSSPSINVSIGGQYSVIVTDGAGCIGGDTVNVTLSNKPVVTPTIVATPKCNDKNGVITLTNPAEAGYKYQWLNPNNTARPGDTTVTLSHLGPGLYKVLVKHPGGCDSIYSVTLNPDNITVTATPGPTNCVAGNDAQNSVQVAINNYPPPSTFPLAQNMIFQAYDQSTNLAYGSPVLSNTQITPVILKEGIYYITVTDPNNSNCVYRVSNIVIQPSPNKPVFDDLGPPRFACGNETIAITGAALGTYGYSWKAYSSSWAQITTGSPFTSNGSGIIANNPSGQTITRNYIVTATNSGCQTIDTIQVTFINYTVRIGLDVKQCISSGAVTVTPTFTPAIPASVTRNFQYIWYDGATQLPDNSPTLTVSTVGGHNIKLEVVDNRLPSTCPKPTSPQKLVTLDNAPLDRLGPDKNGGCIGNEVVVNAGTYPTGTTYTWSSLDYNIPPASISAPSLTVNKPGVLWLNVTNGVCLNRFDVIINYNKPPASGLPADTLFCRRKSSSILLRGGPDGYSYNWVDSATQASIGTGPEIEISEGGKFYLTIEDKNGCITTDSISVVEECEGDIHVGNAFTPNGDNKNDFLVFTGKNIGSFDLSVFNRWGQLIYHGDSPSKGWDGTAGNGKPAPTGTYVYVITYKSTKGDTNKKYKQKGSVALIR